MKKFGITLAVFMMVLLVPLAHAAADEDTMGGASTVSNVPPTCEITQPADGSSHYTNTSISFEATASDNNNDNLTYWWNFGDGSDNVYGASATHSYPSAGTYTVVLTVSDNYENVSDNITISVTSPPEPGPGPLPSDTTPPTLTVLTPIAMEVGRHLTVRVSASDASGIDPASIVVKLDDNFVEFTFSDGVIVIGLSDLEPGDHVLKVSAADTEGNSREQTIQFTVVHEIITVRLDVVNAGEGVMVDFSAHATPVRRVTLVPSQNLDNALVNMRALDERPSGLPAPPGVVFAYLEFSTDILLENATIEFVVPRVWSEGNGVDGDTIRLYRYSSGWQELPTDRIGENATHVFYSAITPGFSTFAIVGQVSSPATGQPVQPDWILITLLVLLVTVVCAGIISSLFATGKLKLSKASRSASRRRAGRKRSRR